MTHKTREFLLKMFLTLNLEPLAGCFKTGKCALNSKWYFSHTGFVIQRVAQYNSHRALDGYRGTGKDSIWILERRVFKYKSQKKITFLK